MGRSIFLLILIIEHIWARNMETIEICNNLKCDSKSNISVCGLRNEGNRVRLKLFENECALLKHGCEVDESDAFGLISFKYCERMLTTNQKYDEDLIPKTESIEELVAHKNKVYNKQTNTSVVDKNNIDNDKCKKCDPSIKDKICGIRKDGDGYRVSLFENKCELAKHNCEANVNFVFTDMFICENTYGVQANNTINMSNNTKVDPSINIKEDAKRNKSMIVVIDNSMLGRVNDVNESIDNFFAATHVLDLPIKQIDENELKTRRMRLKNVGPIKVFQPWIIIPKTIHSDYFHAPTLSTCYHKCPTKCPDTYAPVCGVPGIKAREPSIMFQNHCYMDVAQCKMFWENKSETAMTSSYIESSFLFCLGDQLNGLYRFLPLIKTLQHMGRVKKKGRFRYKLRNMKFLNDLAIKEPKLMG